MILRLFASTLGIVLFFGVLIWFAFFVTPQSGDERESTQVPCMVPIMVPPDGHTEYREVDPDPVTHFCPPGAW